MANADAEFQAIADQRDAAIRKLKELEAPALGKFNQLLNKKHTGVELSASEQADLQTASDSLKTVRHAMVIVGQVSLDAMNNSALLQQIADNLRAVSADLKTTVERLGKITEIAATTASVFATVADLAEKFPKP